MLYKVYWSDGGQVPPPMDKEIIEEVNKINDFSEIAVMDLDEAEKAGLYKEVGPELDDKFIELVKKTLLSKESIEAAKDDFTIVYTPLHGTGNKPVRRALEEAGFKNVYVVSEQELPDKNFSTVSYPNPEDPKAFELSLKLAKEKNADIVIATDPDADRLGTAVKNKEGEYVLLTGNMTGSLLTEYILYQKKKSGVLPENAAVIKTIVSTNLAKAIADAYNVKIFDVLTGFKYIGEKIKEFESDGEYEYMFGFEESYGYLAGTHARDKDAVGATALLCEMAAYYKTKGMTLIDALNSLYEKYGYYKDTVESITLKGLDGLSKIQRIMTAFREKRFAEINGAAVKVFKDYKTKTAIEYPEMKEEKINLPVSDVLHYTLADGTWFCVRPSGTEPKIKIYFGINGKNEAETEEKQLNISGYIMNFINGIK